MVETQQIINELLLFAEEGKHTEFRLIKTFSECCSIKKSYKFLKTIDKLLRASADSLLQEHCTDIEAYTSQHYKLLTYTILKNAIEFYEVERRTLELMLGEYEIYLISGNLFDFIWYGGRPEKKLWDHRRFFDGNVTE
jgi:hypothetical protein